MISQYRDIKGKEKGDLEDGNEYISVEEHEDNINNIETDVKEILEKLEDIEIVDLAESLETIRSWLTELGNKLY